MGGIIPITHWQGHLQWPHVTPFITIGSGPILQVLTPCIGSSCTSSTRRHSCVKMPCWWSPIASSMWDQQITPKFTYVHILFCVFQCWQDTLKWIWAARLGIFAFVKRGFYLQMTSWWCDFGDWIVWGTNQLPAEHEALLIRQNAPDDR